MVTTWYIYCTYRFPIYTYGNSFRQVGKSAYQAGALWQWALHSCAAHSCEGSGKRVNRTAGKAEALAICMKKSGCRKVG